ncbi:MAG: hypothetical protein J7K68_05650 [Candidatus Diapherotrites archaeon]|nr:hypothetical protein [Candidatus Diapherotrites archaeon]
MKTLVSLVRYLSPEEKRSVIDELVKRGYSVEVDSWSPKNRLLVEGNIKEQIVGIAYTIPILVEEHCDNIEDAVNMINRFCEKHNIHNISLELFSQSLSGIQSLLDTSEKEGAKNKVYVGLLQDEKIHVRLGIISEKPAEIGNIIIVLESPKTVEEIVGFIRLCHVFGVELRVSTNNDYRTLDALSRAKFALEEFPIDMRVYPTTEKAIEGMACIGFSLWGDEELPEINSPTALVFGNHERGLSLDTLRRCDKVVHLGPKSDKSMTASQAAAFVLGLLSKSSQSF